MNEADEYWLGYLRKTGAKEGDLRYGGELGLGCDAQSSCEMLALALCGKKRAFCAALAAFHLDGERLPAAGTHYVLTDWRGFPRGIIKTEKVAVLPYNALTWEMAQKEGEDSSMAEWKLRRDEFFAEDSALMGYEFTPSMPVVFEEFRLLASG